MVSEYRKEQRKVDVTERLRQAIRAYELTANGEMAHVDMMRDALAEIEKWRGANAK